LKKKFLLKKFFRRRTGRKPIKLVGEGRGLLTFDESRRAEDRKRKKFDKNKSLRIKSRPNSVKVRGEKIQVEKKGAQKSKSKKGPGMFGSVKKNLIVDDQTKLAYGYRQYKKERPRSKYTNKRRK